MMHKRLDSLVTARIHTLLWAVLIIFFFCYYQRIFDMDNLLTKSICYLALISTAIWGVFISKNIENRVTKWAMLIFNSLVLLAAIVAVIML